MSKAQPQGAKGKGISGIPTNEASPELIRLSDSSILGRVSLADSTQRHRSLEDLAELLGQPESRQALE
jgi:hypothetical protein